MSGPRFTPQAVLEIRQQFAARTLNVRGWATAYKVSLETVRRIARGDTYRDLPEAGGPASAPAILPPGSGLAPILAPPREPDEPDAAALAASFARLAAAQAARPLDAQALLDEIQGRAQPGKPGGRPLTSTLPDKETP